MEGEQAKVDPSYQSGIWGLWHSTGCCNAQEGLVPCTCTKQEGLHKGSTKKKLAKVLKAVESKGKLQEDNAHAPFTVSKQPSSRAKP
ncbi:uncharacterized [Tachysurus ichikawai]